MAARSLKGLGGIGVILTAITIMLGPRLLRGQTSFGTIVGTVMDSSSAGIPGGNVTITNAQSSNQGPYQVLVSNTSGSVTSVVAMLTVGSSMIIRRSANS